jgi:hypothetical protein
MSLFVTKYGALSAHLRHLAPVRWARSH